MSSAYRFPGIGSYYGFADEGFYNRRRGRRSINDQDEDFVSLGKKVKKLGKHLAQIKTPIGNRENPARSCLDLVHCGRKMEDGKNCACLS